ncbi:thiol reductant ABC exporter subunit CydD [Streptomyces acidicola]|uniref:thiol reductant ABC exporter subunit CydD n=1 Tax=Streptomyces acidicola TaxID=2596892 RepID=UPI00382A12AD
MQKDLARLIRTDRAVLRHLTLCLVAAVAAGLLVLAQAELLAGVLSGRYASGALGVLVAVVAVRALLAWVQTVAAGHTASGVKSRLRDRLATRWGESDPLRPGERRSGELVTLVGRGLDGLDLYLTGYLPAVAVAAVVPVAVLVRLFTADVASAAVVLVTLPLIPLFGVLVGRHTKAVTERQWQAMTRLGGHFLDAVRGLPTLRTFGRARYQVSVIERMAEAHRAATLRTLRVAFLSALVLELAASLSLALVAVPIGLRLLGGTLDLATGLLVLLLAPEAYLPLRLLGNQFHVAMEGVTTAEHAFALLDEKTGVEEACETTNGRSAPVSGSPANGTNGSCTPSAGTMPHAPVAVAGPPEIRLEGVTVCHPGRDQPALTDVSLVVRPGERVALVGENGAGKSTLLLAMLGLVTPRSGRVLVGGAPPGGAPGGRRRFAYVPQRPHLFAVSVVDNIRLGAPDATDQEVRSAAAAADAAEFIEELPQRYATRLAERAADLSAGQRQRIALARAFCRPGADVLLLDEPTARLDTHSEAAVVHATRALADGRTVVIVAHRPAMIALADRVITLHAGRVVSDTATGPGPTARADGAGAAGIDRGVRAERCRRVRGCGE